MLTKIQSDLEQIAGFDESLWEHLRNKKIFATGCTGFIGTWIIHSFLYINKKFNLNSQLHCLTRNPEKNISKFPGIHFFKGDIETFNFPQGNYDYLIHGAIEVSTFQNGDDPSALLDVAYLGTKRIIDFAKEANLKKILFLSSGAAYGTQPLELPLLLESYNGAPETNLLRSTYGEAKRIGEQLLFNQSVPTTSARIFACAGPFLPLESKFAISNFLESCLTGKNIKIQSNGKTTRSYLYAADLTLWLWILLLKGRDKQIYNVGSESETSIYDLALKVKGVTKSPVEIEVLGNEKEYNRYIPANGKIRSEFKISQPLSLEVSIKRSYEFLKENYAV